MITQHNQRWRSRRDSYRPAGEVIRTADYEVAPIATDRVARSFVREHHYSGSYPAARYRFGLYRGAQLAGVAVFSHPVNNRTLTSCLPGSARESVELGRFVLLDEVPGNGETWFLARCFEQLRREGLLGVVSFSDPMPRTNALGRRVFAGHVGTIYQAFNASYLGQSRRDTLRLLPDGTSLPNRSLAKVRAQHRGHGPVEDLLACFGAEPRRAGECPSAWLDRVLPEVTTKVRHPGNHKYVWGLSKRVKRHLSPSLPYPKLHAA
jgi:hypothetical protein